MSFQRILIALDFSPCAEHVARRGGELARRLGARPSLLYVAPPPQVPPDTPMPVPDSSAVRGLTVEEYLLRSAQRRLAHYVDLVGDQDFPTRVVVRFGEPAEVIADEALECGAGLIVIGTRGRSGLARAVHGSVAERVVRAADVPVTVVRSRWHPGCAASSCNWCVEEAPEEELRVVAEQAG